MAALLKTLYGDNMPDLFIAGHRCVSAGRCEQDTMRARWEVTLPPPPALPLARLCSMGGAVVVHVANQKMVPKIRGLVVVDVVEGAPSDAGQSTRRPRPLMSWCGLAHAFDILPGTAIEAIAGYDMMHYIHSRPRRFETVEDAVRWRCVSGPCCPARQYRLRC